MGLITAVKPPEAVVHSVDLDVRGSPSAFLVRDKSFENDHREDGAEFRPEATLRLQLIGELFAAITIDRDDLIGLSQPEQDQFSQAGTD